jgi:predicted nucleotidyltransferase component of viral defense system
VELLELLTELQKEPLLKDHVLAGGTALALQLGHRKSIDIDLFSNKYQNNKNILNMLENKYKYYELINIDDKSLQVIIKNIKVDIIGINQNIIDLPIIEENIKYFGKKDIAAMKLRAVLYRMQPRDYIDIVYLLKEISMDYMFELYKQKFNENDITMLKIKLLASKDFQNKDWVNEIVMLKNDINIFEIPKILDNEINKYNKKRKIGKINFINNIIRKIKGSRS